MVCQRIFEALKRIFLIFVCEHRDFYLNDFQPRTGDMPVERHSTRKVRLYLFKR